MTTISSPSCRLSSDRYSQNVIEPIALPAFSSGECAPGILQWATMFLAVVLGGEALALDIESFDKRRHRRFYAGADRAFLGEAFDFSGIGTSTPASGEHGYNRSATMISDTYFVSANHLAPKLNVPIRFYHTNEPDSAFEDYTPIWGERISGDVWLGQLNAAPSNNIARYPILDLGEESEYVGQEFYTYGLDPEYWKTGLPFMQSMGLGRNKVKSFWTSSSFGRQMSYSQDAIGSPDSVGGDEAHSVGGDSGKPSFISVNGQLGLLGVHSTTASDAFLPPLIQSINLGLSRRSRESLSVLTGVPEPSSLTMVLSSAMLVSTRRSRRSGSRVCPIA